MLQFFLRTIAGVLMGIVVWVPLIGLFLLWKIRTSGYIRFDVFGAGLIETGPAVVILLACAAFHGAVVGVGTGLFQVAHSWRGALAGIAATELLLAGMCIYSAFAAGFTRWSALFEALSGILVVFIVSSAVFLIPSALIGVGTTKTSNYIISKIGQRTR